MTINYSKSRRQQDKGTTSVICELLVSNRTILNGLKVLDLSTEITGPYAAKLLADNGAEVVKVESPIGDVWRYHISYSQQTENHELDPQYLTLNTSKKGITLDIIQDSGRQLFIELVKIADAIIENYRPDFLNSFTPRSYSEDDKDICWTIS